MTKQVFVGRKTELNKLEKMYATDEFQMAVFYGRRRVGKTTLINQFCKGKKTIFCVGIESTEKENLAISGVVRITQIADLHISIK